MMAEETAEEAAVEAAVEAATAAAAGWSRKKKTWQCGEKGGTHRTERSTLRIAKRKGM